MAGPQGSYRRGDDMVYGFWLALRSNGDVKLTRKAPSLTRDERGMYVELTVPLAIFSTPSLRATINIVDTPGVPPQIDVQAAESALREALGVDIDLRVIPAGEES